MPQPHDVIFSDSDTPAQAAFMVASASTVLDAMAPMVHLEGGAFVMGADETIEGMPTRSRDDLALQGVEVREFFLDTTAVTNEQVCGKNICLPKLHPA